MPDEQPKIVVEVPSSSDYSPVPSPQTSKLEKFKKGWIEAIAFPDTLADMAYAVAASVAIPALLTSCWVSLPLPSFIRLGVLGVLAITGALMCYLRQAVPDVDEELTFRAFLVALGVILGL
ncbi:hypothetical protein [Nostoc sp. PA-18-2419]|uniref:hypothetical protein n=1 Tax=Nostoc sp. PA-18-2419 TaxID=2575443 RepID=UPI001107D8B1|nr:hypothetical protein [Nostoc sp. PA-18-2419]